MIASCIFEVGTTRVFTTKNLGLTGTNPEQRIHLETRFNQFRGLWERLRFFGQLMSKTTCNIVIYRFFSMYVFTCFIFVNLTWRIMLCDYFNRKLFGFNLNLEKDSITKQFIIKTQPYTYGEYMWNNVFIVYSHCFRFHRVNAYITCSAKYNTTLHCILSDIHLISIGRRTKG